MRVQSILLVALAALAATLEASASAADSGAEEARAMRLREIVVEHFYGECCAVCGGTCSVAEILASLDPGSRLLLGPAPDLDFIRGLKSDVPPPQVRLDPTGRLSVGIHSFGRRTGRQFLAAVDSLDRSRLTAMTVDLRGNGGGSLESALAIAEAFAPSGALLLEVVGRTGVRTFHSAGSRRFSGLPVDVFVDEKTASSAEVLAWLLRRYAGARIRGRRTAGKGTVQEVFRVDPRARLLLTTGVYRLPDETSLEGAGISPEAGL